MGNTISEADMSPYLIKILKKMCDYVGADFDKVNFKEEDWYLKYEWTVDKSNEFKEWMVNYLHDNTKARNYICNIPLKSKEYLMEVVNYFNFNYGWKFSESVMEENDNLSC